MDTHGIIRLPIYLERLARGLVNPMPLLEPHRVTPLAAHLDGNNGFGFVVANRAMAESIAMAEAYRLGLTATRGNARRHVEDDRAAGPARHADRTACRR